MQIFRQLSFVLFFIVLLPLSACSSKLSLPYLSPDDRILAFGDSLTYGSGAKRNESYPYVLQKLLNRQVINAGIPGELSYQGLLRLPDLLDKFQPKLLILCHGANDILKRRDLDVMADNLIKMIVLAKERDISVVLLGVPQYSLFLTMLEQYNDIAEKMDVVLLADILPDILSDRTLKADYVHPNKAGYQLMADEIYAALQERGATD